MRAQVWTLDVINSEARINAQLTPPVHAALNAEVLAVGNAIKRLYAYSYQVLRLTSCARPDR